MDKKTIYEIAVLVVVGVIIGLYFGFYNKNSKSNQSSSSNASPIQKLSIDQASKFFTDRQIIFDSNCKPTPEKLTVKDNAAIMIVNQGKDDNTFSLGQTSFKISAGQYKLTTVNSKMLSNNIIVGCGANKSAASITIQ